jgi:hypothetical protein
MRNLPNTGPDLRTLALGDPSNDERILEGNDAQCKLRQLERPGIGSNPASP